MFSKLCLKNFRHVKNISLQFWECNSFRLTISTILQTQEIGSSTHYLGQSSLQHILDWDEKVEMSLLKSRGHLVSWMWHTRMWFLIQEFESLSQKGNLHIVKECLLHLYVLRFISKGLLLSHLGAIVVKWWKKIPGNKTEIWIWLQMALNPKLLLGLGLLPI